MQQGIQSAKRFREWTVLVALLGIVFGIAGCSMTAVQPISRDATVFATGTSPTQAKPDAILRGSFDVLGVETFAADRIASFPGANEAGFTGGAHGSDFQVGARGLGGVMGTLEREVVASLYEIHTLAGAELGTLQQMQQKQFMSGLPMSTPGFGDAARQPLLALSDVSRTPSPFGMGPEIYMPDVALISSGSVAAASVDRRGERVLEAVIEDGGLDDASATEGESVASGEVIKVIPAPVQVRSAASVQTRVVEVVIEDGGLDDASATEGESVESREVIKMIPLPASSDRDGLGVTGPTKIASRVGKQNSGAPNFPTSTALKAELVIPAPMREARTLPVSAVSPAPETFFVTDTGEIGDLEFEIKELGSVEIVASLGGFIARHEEIDTFGEILSDELDTSAVPVVEYPIFAEPVSRKLLPLPSWPVQELQTHTPAIAAAATTLTDLNSDTVAVREGFENVYFDFDRWAISKPMQAQLSASAQWLQAHPETMVSIEGYCDARGGRRYNLALAEKRASAVKQFWVDLGVAEQRLSTISYGREGLTCVTDDVQCHKANRRANLVVK